MKALFIIGVVLFSIGIVYGATNNKPNVGIQPMQPNSGLKPQIVSASILTGFTLMIISGIMYLRS